MKELLILGVVLWALKLRGEKPKDEEADGDGGWVPPPEEGDPVERFFEGLEKLRTWEQMYEYVKRHKDKFVFLLKQWPIIVWIVNVGLIVKREAEWKRNRDQVFAMEDELLEPVWGDWDFEQKRDFVATYPGGLYRQMRIRWPADMNPRYRYGDPSMRHELREKVRSFEASYGDGDRVFPSAWHSSHAAYWKLWSERPWIEEPPISWPKIIWKG
jgi:hypothetical protein